MCIGDDYSSRKTSPRGNRAYAKAPWEKRSCSIIRGKMRLTTGRSDAVITRLTVQRDNSPGSKRSPRTPARDLSDFPVFKCTNTVYRDREIPINFKSKSGAYRGLHRTSFAVGWSRIHVIP